MCVQNRVKISIIFFPDFPQPLLALYCLRAEVSLLHAWLLAPYIHLYNDVNARRAVIGRCP